MNLLAILGSDDTLGLIVETMEPLGFSLIRYRHVPKAMDNIDEINPSTIIISARDFPRHWKTLTQFVRYSRPKPDCPIIILAGPNFSLDDASQAFYLGADGIVSEDLRPSEIGQLRRLLSRHLHLEDKQKNAPRHVEGSGEMGVCVVNPVDRSLVTGPVKTLSASEISFQPDPAAAGNTLEEGMELSECSIRIGNDFITPICRVARTAPDLSVEFIFFPGVDRMLLDNYLEKLRAKQAEAE
jgi:DNA-binding response OmpR family regulator